MRSICVLTIRSHSPAAAPVRGRRIGLATTARSLEGAPGNDAGYGIASLALRINQEARAFFGSEPAKHL
jgi:hypothetical protein